MILVSFVFSIIYLSALLYLYIKSRKEIRKVISLFSGIILTMIINLIIWQPTFKTEVLQKEDRSPILLIDRSLSMNQFNSDSILKSIRSDIKDIKKIRVFTFGESCQTENIKDINFTDSASIFPEEFIQKNIHSPLILLSDALYQNQPNSLTLSENKQMYYIPLKRKDYSNHITLNTSSEIIQSGQKKAVIDIELSGFAKDSLNQLTVKLFKNNKELKSKTITYKSGNIYLTKSLTIPQLPFGRHILSLNTYQNDSLIQTKELILKSTPDIFKINISSNSPSLDERFIKLAIQKTENLKISDSNNSDISIIFNKKQKSTSLVNLYISNSTMPLDFKENTIKITSNEPGFMNFTSLPKPRKIYNSSLKGKKIITGSIDDKKIHILTQVINENSISLFLNITGFWKWDFRDLYSSNNPDQSFTSSLLDYLKKTAIKTRLSEPLVIKTDLRNLPHSDIYTIYHPFSNPSDNNTLNLTLIDNKGNKVFNRKKKLNTLLEKDTVIINTEKSYSSSLFELSYGSKNFNIEKQVTANNNIMEISTSDQNQLFLNKYFHKLDIKDKSKLSQITNKDYISKSITINKEFNIHRNWYLLISAILLLTILWAIKPD